MEQFHFDFFINIINFDRDNIRYFPCIVIIEYYVEILFFKFLYHTKLLQKSEMRKEIVIELSYKGFSRASDYS